MAEQWIKEDRIFTSNSFRTHMSDFLRLLPLYKFGGIYFDSDVIILKSVDDLPFNFASNEDPSNGIFVWYDFEEILVNFFLYNPEYINNSALGFESADIGHGILEEILRYVQHL